LQPYYADAFYNRGNVLFAEGHTDEAIADWERTLQIQPNDADAHTSLGNALLKRGSPQEAIGHYEKALSLAPDDPHSRNNLAWVLATAPDASIRDGARAVGLAQEAVQLSSGRDPLFLRTLAAAYAESGRFAEALTVAQQAIVMANMQGKTDVVNRVKEDLLLYRGHVPLRQNSFGN
jgi:tetratricopeptide (TPR) repeat protein